MVNVGHLERLRTLQAALQNGELDQQDCLETLLVGDDDGYGRLWDACREAAQTGAPAPALDWAVIVIEQCMDDPAQRTAGMARALVDLARLTASADMSTLTSIRYAWAGACTLPRRAQGPLARQADAEFPPIVNRLAAELGRRDADEWTHRAVLIQAWLLLESRSPRQRRAIQASIGEGGASVHGQLVLSVQPDGPPGLYPDPRTMSLVTGTSALTETIDAVWNAEAANRAVHICLLWSFVPDEVLDWDQRITSALRSEFTDLLTEVFGPPPTGHKNGTSSVAFSPDGLILASGGATPGVIVWDTGSGTSLREMAGHDGFVTSVAFSPDGRILAGGSAGKATLWDVNTGTPIRELPGEASSVAFTPDGRILASGSAGKATLWDVNTGTPIRELPGATGGVKSVAFSPDGRILAGGCAGGKIAKRDDLLAPRVGPGKTILWDVDTGAVIRELADTTGGAVSLAFSPGARILAGCSTTKAALWDVDTGALIRELPGRFVTSVAFSPDGRILANSDLGGTIQLRNVET